MFSFGIGFDAETSQATFTYDYDVSDETEPEVIGQLDYTGSIGEFPSRFCYDLDVSC